MATVAGHEVWRNHPLPAGWEACYDPRQKRYYFINHASRATTWEDPRKTAWEHQQLQQLVLQPTRLTPDERLLNSLKKQHPLADEEVIKAILIDVSNNEMKAKNKLHSLGFIAKQVTPIPKVQSSPQVQKPQIGPQEVIKPKVMKSVTHVVDKAKESPTAPRLQFETSGEIAKVKESTVAPRPQTETSTTAKVETKSPHVTIKPQLGPNEDEKAKTKAKLTKEFSDCPARIMDIALDASQYNEQKARLLLQSMDSNKLGDRKSSRVERGRDKTNGETPAGKNDTPVSPVEQSVPADSAPCISTMPPHSFPKPIYTGDTQKKTFPRKEQTLERKQIVEPESIGVYRSVNQVQAVGPNPTLAKGPANNLLCSNTIAVGPNQSHWKGPNRDLAIGPNRNLLSGRQ